MTYKLTEIVKLVRKKIKPVNIQQSETVKSAKKEKNNGLRENRSNSDYKDYQEWAF